MHSQPFLSLSVPLPLFSIKMTNEICMNLETFPGFKNTTELQARVYDIIPLLQSDIKIIDVKGTTSKFKASLKCNLKNADDVQRLI